MYEMSRTRRSLLTPKGVFHEYDKAACCSHPPRVYPLRRSRARPATDAAGTGLVAGAPAADAAGLPRLDFRAVGRAMDVQARSRPLVDRGGCRTHRDQRIEHP